jgi:GAF domain-containing protein
MRTEHVGWYASAVIGAFGRVAAAVVAGRRRDEVLQVIASSARQLVDADLAGVTLLLDDGDVLTVAADGLDAELYRGRRYASEGTTTDKVLRTGKIVVIEDMSTAPLVRARLPDADMGPTVFVPIIIDGPYGSLSVSRRIGREPFDDDEISVLATFAAQAALVLERDCQRRRAAELDRVAEQARIAAQLQENAVNEIFNASLLLSRLANEIGDSDKQGLVFHSIDALDNAIKLIRQAAFGLNDPSTNPEDA